MYLGVILNNVLIRILVLLPEEAKVGTMLFRHGELMNTFLDIRGLGIIMMAHSVENASKRVIAIWALK